MSVEGKPLKHSGILLFSSRSRTPAKSTMASVKPSADPTPLTTDPSSEYSSVMFRIVTPSTAQFVVISGRYTPRALYSEGEVLLITISTSCTSTAMTRIKAMV